MDAIRFRHIGKSVAAGAVAFAAVALTAGACVAFRAVPEVSDLMLPMGDGVKLYTIVSRPRGAEKCPVIVTRTPYVEETHANKTMVGMMSIPAGA